MNYCVKAIKPENQVIVKGSILDGIIGYCISVSYANIDRRFLSASISVSFPLSLYHCCLALNVNVLFTLFSSQLVYSSLNVSRALLCTGLVTCFLHPPLMLYTDQSILEGTVSSVYMLNV